MPYLSTVIIENSPLQAFVQKELDSLVRFFAAKEHLKKNIMNIDVSPLSSREFNEGSGTLNIQLGRSYRWRLQIYGRHQEAIYLGMWTKTVGCPGWCWGWGRWSWWVRWRCWWLSGNRWVLGLSLSRRHLWWRLGLVMWPVHRFSITLLCLLLLLLLLLLWRLMGRTRHARMRVYHAMTARTWW